MATPMKTPSPIPTLARLERPLDLDEPVLAATVGEEVVVKDELLELLEEEVAVMLK